MNFLKLISGEILEESERSENTQNDRKSKKKKKKQKDEGKDEANSLSKAQRREEKILSLSNALMDDWKQLKVCLSLCLTLVTFEGVKIKNNYEVILYNLTVLFSEEFFDHMKILSKELYIQDRTKLIINSAIFVY